MKVKGDTGAESTQMRQLSGLSGWEAGLHEQRPKVTQGALPCSSPLRKDGSHGSQVGRLDHVSDGQRLSRESE
jgi:hypothetical protein